MTPPLQGIFLDSAMFLCSQILPSCDCSQFVRIALPWHVCLWIAFVVGDDSFAWGLFSGWWHSLGMEFVCGLLVLLATTPLLSDDAAGYLLCLDLELCLWLHLLLATTPLLSDDAAWCLVVGEDTFVRRRLGARSLATHSDDTVQNLLQLCWRYCTSSCQRYAE